ncbi:MAG TPA: methionine aminotransferase [Steroidobacteraceae bacterium]
MRLHSKLPHIGTTIFTVMTNRARELGAVNLAQGFPDYDAPARLKELVGQHVAAGHNQYAPMTGVAELRQQIALKLEASYGRLPDPESEITITLGATEGIFSAISALVHPGDDVIMFDPSYDSYAPAVLLAGGRPVRIPLQPPLFSIDWQRVRDAVSPRLRLAMINTPHNPTGSVLSASDLATLADVLRPTNAMVLADEVYEHMVFDGARHASILEHPELYARGMAVFSFGKSMHATGWRVGYTVAPVDFTREIRRVHQFNTFSIATPLQHAIADFLKQEPQHSQELGQFYQRKRDYFLERLQGSKFRWTPSAGTYFQLLDYSEISQQSDTDFAETLLQKVGVASIPVSPFYATSPHLSVVRLCFAKNESTLADAAERLCRL